MEIFKFLFPSLNLGGKICQAPSYNWNIKMYGVLRKLGPPKELAISSKGCGHSGIEREDRNLNINVLYPYVCKHHTASILIIT